ncbi:MAG TPA: cupin domain-containing protein [Vicinamibacteria bacterium]|nr:cupin domain-containing protein [Vicinamibacteria bacterium]
MAADPAREPLGILGGLTAAAFLFRHWQKRPLLVRRAFPGFRDPLTPHELAGLSTEPHVESRLVLERGGRRPWTVVRGPQDAARLRRLPRSHWTLLVENADAHVPALADLLDAFEFLPRWRVDDVMVSVAPRGGTVGPHIDRYDVFLLQGRGRRRWQIDERAREIHHPGLDLRILRSFHATAEWVLDPGDMLYLPPRLAHHGVALEDCLTYSIGFRAPGTRDLLFGCLERMARRADPGALYEDADLEPQEEPGEIGARALARVRGMLAEAWDPASSADLPRLVGEILTEPRAGGPVSRARRLTTAEVSTRLRRGAGLVRSPASRAAFVRRGRSADLFVDGHVHALPVSLARAASLLTRTRRIGAREILPFLRRERFLALLADLVNAGSYAFARAAVERPSPSGARSAPGRSRTARGSRSRGGRR